MPLQNKRSSVASRQQQSSNSAAVKLCRHKTTIHHQLSIATLHSLFAMKSIEAFILIVIGTVATASEPVFSPTAAIERELAEYPTRRPSVVSMLSVCLLVLKTSAAAAEHL